MVRLQVWHVSDGHLLSTIRNLTPLNLAFTPDSQQLIKFDEYDQTLGKWQVSNGQPLPDQKLPYNPEKFNSDYSLAVARDDQGLHIYELASNKQVTLVPAKNVRAQKYDFSSNYKFLLAEDPTDTSLEIWEVASAKRLAVIPIPTDLVQVIISPDGSKLALATQNGGTRIIDAHTGQNIAVLQAQNGYLAGLEFSPDSQLILNHNGGAAAGLGVWEVASGNQIAVLQTQRVGNDVSAAEFSPDSRQVITAEANQTARIWQVGDPKPLVSIAQPDSLNLETASHSITPDRQLVVVNGKAGGIEVWNINTGQKTQQFPGSQPALSPDGKLVLAINSTSGQLWDITTGKLTGELRGHTGDLLSAAWSTDGKSILTVSKDKTARLWNATTYQSTATLQDPAYQIIRAVFSPDSQLVATLDQNGSPRLWQLSGNPSSVTLSDKNIAGLNWSPDSKFLAGNFQNGNVKVWAVSTGKEVLASKFSSVVGQQSNWSANSQLLIVNDGNGNAQVYDVTTGAVLTTVQGGVPDYPILRVGFSPNSQYAITSSEGGHIYVWDSKIGRRLLELNHSGYVFLAAFSPDGQLILSSASDSGSRVWEAATGVPLAVLHQDRAYWDVSGKLILSIDTDKANSEILQIYNCDLCGSLDELATLAHNRVGRDLTAAEQQQLDTLFLPAPTPAANNLAPTATATSGPQTVGGASAIITATTTNEPTATLSGANPTSITAPFQTAPVFPAPTPVPTVQIPIPSVPREVPVVTTIAPTPSPVSATVAPPSATAVPAATTPATIASPTTIASVAACAIVPTSGFGNVYKSIAGLPAKIGCPTENEHNIVIAYRAFEKGFMFYRQDTDQIWVFYGLGSGTWEVYPNVNQPSASCSTPPPGLYEPNSGFGVVWCNHKLQSKLGFSTQPQQYTNALGAAQLYQSGTMFFNPGGEADGNSHIYVLYNNDHTFINVLNKN